MSNFENIAQALSAIKGNKMRSILTMLGIIIGISAVIAIFTLGEGMQDFINSNIQSAGAGLIITSVKQRGEEEIAGGLISFATSSSETPTESDLINDEMLNGVRNMLGERLGGIGLIETPTQSAKLRYENKEAVVSLNGTNHEFFEVYAMDVIAGRALREEDNSGEKRVGVISSAAAIKLFGDYSKALGKTTEFADGSSMFEYTIVGVYEYESDIAGMMMAADSFPTDMYAPVSTVKRDYNMMDNYRSIYVAGRLGEDVQGLTDDLNRYLEKIYEKNPKWVAEAMNFESQLETFNGILGMVTTVIGIIAGISLLVGGVGVMNIMLVSVTERTKEIGTRMAIGARSSYIRMQFITESLVLCVLGGIIGIVLGMILGYVGTGIIGFPSTAPVGAIIVSVLFSILIGVFFGAYPANKAAKLQPVEALRHE